MARRAPRKPHPPPAERRLLYAALLFCATLAAYVPALQGGLLWDDVAYVTKPELQPLHGLWRIWFDLGATGQYYPLLYSAFWLEHRIWGDAVLGYHLVNIALHVVSAFLVVLIVRRLALPGAWLAGLIFALHPVCVESVAWISEQKNTLSAAFCLGSVFAYLQFDQTRRQSRYYPALALFVLALATKTVTATLPAVLLVLLWWQRGRIEWKRDVLPLLPWFALAVPAGMLTAWMERSVVGAHGSEFTLTLLQRILLAGRALWFYATKLLLPWNLTFFYPHWRLDPGLWWQWLFPAGVLGVTVAFWLVARRGLRGPLAALLIFAGTLLPVLGFVNVYPFRFSYVADHFQYLASLAIIIPLAGAILNVSKRVSVPAILVIILGILTLRQSAIYRDSETLYRETLARNPESWVAHSNLGQIEFATPGRLTHAIREYEAALRIKPDDAQAHVGIGSALMMMPGRLTDAIPHFEAALRIQPDLAEAHSDLGSALARSGRLPDAVAQFQEAVRLQPGYAEAHANLAAALSETGRLADAIGEYRAALRLRPDLAQVHYNLGRALAIMRGHDQEAIAECEAALRLRPDLQAARQTIQELRAGRQ